MNEESETDGPADEAFEVYVSVDAYRIRARILTVLRSRKQAPSRPFLPEYFQVPHQRNRQSEHPKLDTTCSRLIQVSSILSLRNLFMRVGYLQSEA